MKNKNIEIKNALISVSNKDKIVEFAKELQKRNIEIISTGGTSKILKENSIKVREISEVTKFPECLDGRVKTLHPNIHAAILADRTKEDHKETLKRLNIEPIDMVVVNLYPFKQTVLKENVSMEEIIENIDIGGPTIIRAAAKNYKNVVVIVNPNRYEEIIKEIDEKGYVSLNTKQKLCREAFEHTAYYDGMISRYFSSVFNKEEILPDKISFSFEKIYETRYGENPHQRGALYANPLYKNSSIVNAKVLNGKEMSFNNILDSDAALRIIREFEEPTVAIVKHNNPCGVATANTIKEAFEKAYECDKESAFGGIIALNRKCDLETAKLITSFFNEVVIATAFEDNALEELKKKKNLRVLIVNNNEKNIQGNNSEYLDIKKIDGGLLVQEKDYLGLKKEELKVVSKRKPTEKEMEDLIFAWKIVKHVKSNAIVIAKDKATIGLGIGQTSRVRSVKIAIDQAGERSKGAVLASEAFFPFRDSVDKAAEAGITAIIETGGSVRDEEVIKAADEHNIALVFSGIRHFKH